MVAMVLTWVPHQKGSCMACYAGDDQGLQPPIWLRLSCAMPFDPGKPENSASSIALAWFQVSPCSDFCVLAFSHIHAFQGDLASCRTDHSSGIQHNVPAEYVSILIMLIGQACLPQLSASQ